jgi:hypothetical protein
LVSIAASESDRLLDLDCGIALFDPLGSKSNADTELAKTLLDVDVWHTRIMSRKQIM